MTGIAFSYHAGGTFQALIAPNEQAWEMMLSLTKSCLASLFGANRTGCRMHFLYHMLVVSALRTATILAGNTVGKYGS